MTLSASCSSLGLKQKLVFWLRKEDTNISITTGHSVLLTNFYIKFSTKAKQTKEIILKTIQFLNFLLTEKP